MSEAYEGGAGTDGKQTRSFAKVNSAARRDDGACQNPWKQGQRRTRSESKPPVRLKALKGKNAGNLRPCRCSSAQGGKMKRLMWLAIIGALAACVVLLLNRDDLSRYSRMRRM
jgi:hypothetical protein